MTKRKVFNITDLNNEDVNSLQQVAKENGINVQQASIINLAIELFFRDKQTDYSNLLELMRQEQLY